MRTSTILVVDDDPAVRRLAEHILQSEGYRVYVADGAADASQSRTNSSVDWTSY